MPRRSSGARPVMLLRAGLRTRLRQRHVARRGFLRGVGRVGVPWVREIKEFLIGRAAQQQGGEIST